MEYASHRKLTTISVKLDAEDLAKLDALVQHEEFCGKGHIDTRYTPYWFRPKRSHAIRAAIRSASPDGKSE
jgi:metal-responsive CopG/Arc/MetJ family transcriptional regulator